MQLVITVVTVKATILLCNNSVIPFLKKPSVFFYDFYLRETIKTGNRKRTRESLVHDIYRHTCICPRTEF